MKSSKMSFDFSDKPELVALLRTYAAESGKSQKTILVTALEAYFSSQMENRMLLKAAEKSFKEWENEDDEIYNDL
ncbi:MAG: hypothetical protein HYW49_00320 [Deltaproteobacteria bacterium]|nr:hypothetical protein [Deltaproteobacteria bacterium]